MPDALVWGTLAVPERKQEAFMAATVSPAAWADSPEGFFEWSRTPATSEVLLGELETLPLATAEWLKVGREGGLFECSGVLSLDSFLSARWPLAAFFRAAAEFEGSGELVLLGAGSVMFGYQVTVGHGQSRFETLSLPSYRNWLRRRAIVELVSSPRLPVAQRPSLLVKSELPRPAKRRAARK